MPPYPGFIGGSSVLQSIIFDAEDTVNWYVEKAQSATATSPQALFPSPGFNRYGNGPDIGGRGACNAGSRTFIAAGFAFNELNADGSITFRGALAQDSNPAQMFYNGTVGGQIGIASGGNFYCFVLATNAFSQVLTGETTMTAYAAGFFFSFNVNTGKVKESALNDGLTWSAGIFFQRSLFPDPWQTMFVDSNNLLWLIGTETFEVWYNTGVGTQPWAPLQGLSGRYGIAAPFAFGLSGLGNVWLSANKEGGGQLVISAGGAPQVVSTYAFTTAMGGYQRTSTIGNAEILTYQQLGHTFAAIAFPSVPATWVYDFEGQSFTRRGMWNAPLGRFDLWAPRIHIQAFGKHLVMSRNSGVIAEMDPSFTTEFDGVTGIVRERTAPALTDEHQRIPIDVLELFMDAGLGTVSGQGMNPQMTLRQSVDGGRTYGNERTASVGKIGQYKRRVYWTRLGASSDDVFKVRSTDPAPSRIVDAWLNNKELQ